MTGGDLLDPVLVEDVAWLRVDHRSAVGAARRTAADLAVRLGIEISRCHDIEIAASELADNLLKHAAGGTLLLRACRSATAAGVCLVAIDTGPGIVDLDEALRDGQSTAGTLGIGLGAVTRLADSWDVSTAPGTGTVLTAYFGRCETTLDPEHTRTAGLTRPMGGQSACGDAYAVRTDGAVVTALLADGLGHGPLAAIASAAAVRTFLDADPGSPSHFLEGVHRALRGTRGAAGAVAQIVSPTLLRYAGTGNISGHLAGGDRRRGLVSFAGILGSNARAPRELEYPLTADTVVILHSDGVTDRMALSLTTGVLRRSPLVIAATVLRDFAIRNDDAGILVMRPGVAP